jgi:hypothetical protein
MCLLFREPFSRDFLRNSVRDVAFGVAKSPSIVKVKRKPKQVGRITTRLRCLKRDIVNSLILIFERRDSGHA